MEFVEVINQRHSTRKFLSKSIRSEDLESIIEEASRTPTWLNSQEHKIYIAKGKIAEMIRREYQNQAAKGLIGVSDFSVVHRNEWSNQAQKNMKQFSTDMEDLLGEQFGDFVKAQDDLFNAPILIFLTLPKNSNKWAIMDLGAFAYGILLSASNRGIGSIVAYAIAKYPDIIRKYLEIPKDEDIATGIAIGFEDESHRINEFKSRRMRVDEILTIKS